MSSVGASTEIGAQAAAAGGSGGGGSRLGVAGSGSAGSVAQSASAHPQDASAPWALRKTLPNRPAADRTDIYVRRSSFFPALLHRANGLLAEDSVEYVTVHGLGAAIFTAIRLATMLQTARGDAVVLHSRTSSEALVDDIELRAGGEATGQQVRMNSAIHIRVQKVAGPRGGAGAAMQSVAQTASSASPAAPVIVPVVAARPGGAATTSGAGGLSELQPAGEKAMATDSAAKHAADL